MKAKNESLEKQVAQIIDEKDKIEKTLRDLQTEVIEKLSISGVNFEFKNIKK